MGAQSSIIVTMSAARNLLSEALGFRPKYEGYQAPEKFSRDIGDFLSAQTMLLFRVQTASRQELEELMDYFFSTKVDNYVVVEDD